VQETHPNKLGRESGSQTVELSAQIDNSETIKT